MQGVTTVLVRPVEVPAQIGLEDTEPDEKDRTATRQLLILKVQKL